MNKTELAAKMAEMTQDSHAKAAAMLNAMLTAIGDTLARGESVIITDFGRFEAITKAARMGRNPRTGEMVKIPAGRKVKFRPGKGLKDMVEAPTQKGKGK